MYTTPHTKDRIHRKLDSYEKKYIEWNSRVKQFSLYA